MNIKEKRISKEIVELAEKIKKYRTDVKLVRELEIKKEALEKQVEGLEKNTETLKLNILKQNKLLDQIKGLKIDNRKLKIELENSKENYTFLVTKPGQNTVYGEISREISNAKHEILIFSPWITHIFEELSNFSRKGPNKKTNIKIITRFIKEDIEKGIADLDKLRVLKEKFGAEIRYNNDLHAKVVVLDNSIAIISSANLTKKGLSINYEAGVCLRDKNIVNEVSNFFNEVWGESDPLTEQVIKTIGLTKNETS